VTDKELEKVLKNLTKYNNLAYIERAKIYKHCEEVYGCDPADIDNDEFIDRCDGGAGLCDGMSAKEFHKSMIECIEKN
jgi:hypothetical protein